MSAPGGMRLGLLQEPPRHLFFTGKGGVGKTSLACATAIALSASNLDEMLGVPLGDNPRPVPSVPNLAAMNIDPEAAVERDPQLGLFGFTRRIRHDQPIRPLL